MVPPQMLPTSGPSLQVYVRLVSQLSLAVPPNARNAARLPGHGGTLERHCTLKLAGQVITGGMVSWTVMIWMQQAVFVQSSVTQWVRAMVPPQVPPTSGPSLQVYVRVVSQLSLAVPPNARNAARLPGHGGTLLRHCTEKFGGQVITGGMVSWTVIIWMQHAVLVQSSVTQWVRAMVPPQMPPTSGPSLQV